MPPCKHCKSPKRHDPCWWGIRHKDYNPESYDPPCFDDDWHEACRARERRDWRWIIAVAIVSVIVMLGMLTFATAEDLIEPTPAEAEDIKRWIPQSCCRTNNCCRKVHEGALIQLPKNDVRVAQTGQVLPRTGWSQDGQTWRCTCDWNDSTKNWDVHPHANTRCVFPVPAGS